jgi:hypothetical protein
LGFGHSTCALAALDDLLQIASASVMCWLKVDSQRGDSFDERHMRIEDQHGLLKHHNV